MSSLPRTTSQKLSTGVDALNVRNIVLLRPIKSMIEFKQIIGRGTRIALAVASTFALAAPTTYRMDPVHTDVIAQWSHFGY